MGSEIGHPSFEMKKMGISSWSSLATSLLTKAIERNKPQRCLNWAYKQLWNIHK